MDIRAGLEPRDPVVAARTAALLTVLGAGVSLAFAVLQPPTGQLAGRLAVLAVPLGLAGLSLVFRRATIAWPVVLWLLPPVLGVAAIVTLDLVTRDASAAGQVFLCLPVLYAAAQLRWLGAGLTALVAAAGDALVVFSLEPAAHALADATYVSATCITMGVVLVRARSRQESLVAQLRRVAAIDPLTGLVTRRVLDEAVQSALAGARAGRRHRPGTHRPRPVQEHQRHLRPPGGRRGPGPRRERAGQADPLGHRRLPDGRRRDRRPAARVLARRRDAPRARTSWTPCTRTRSSSRDGTLIAISVSIGVAQVPVHARPSPGSTRSRTRRSTRPSGRPGPGQRAAAQSPSNQTESAG